MKKKDFNNAAWDIYDSTYIQLISLKNGLEFWGYSKRNGYAEKNDKQALLINWIIRMHKSGYLDINHQDKRRTIIDIAYYLNDYPRKTAVLKLNYNYYECLNIGWAMENKEVIHFLDKFYEALKSGNEYQIKSLYIHKKTRYNDPYDLSIKRFITKKSLMYYCHQMIEEKKFTKEQASGFYKRYTEKYFQ